MNGGEVDPRVGCPYRLRRVCEQTLGGPPEREVRVVVGGVELEDAREGGLGRVELRGAEGRDPQQYAAASGASRAAGARSFAAASGRPYPAAADGRRRSGRGCRRWSSSVGSFLSVVPWLGTRAASDLVPGVRSSPDRGSRMSPAQCGIWAVSGMVRGCGARLALIPNRYPPLQGKVEAYNKIVKNEFLAVEDIPNIND